MPPLRPIHFGPFLVTSQVFHTAPHSFSLVNIRPLLPGHVLVCPVRPVPRLAQLTAPEITDLFLEVQRVGKMVERVFGAQGLNVAVQDGEAAGQSVAHVHVHVIPRRGVGKHGDDIYEMMEEGDWAQGERVAQGESGRQGKREFSTFPREEERRNRSVEEMEKEAEWLAKEMEAVE